MRSHRHMSLILAAAAGSLLASTGSGLLPLPEIQQQRSDPPRPTLPREPVSPADTLSRRQRKRERMKEKQTRAAGIPGAKLWKKAKRGKA